MSRRIARLIWRRPMPAMTFLFCAAIGFIVVFGVVSSAAAGADETEAAEGKLEVETWLMLPAVDLPRPALADRDSSLKELLAQSRLSRWQPWPAAGTEVEWPGREDGRRWERRAATDGRLRLGEAGENPRLAAAAFMIEVQGYRSLKLSVRSPHLLRVYVDGKMVVSKDTADANESEEDESDTADPRGEEIHAELHLIDGKHLVGVHALSDPQGPDRWSVSATLEGSEEELGRVRLGVSAEHRLRLEDLLDVDSIDGIDLSADGRRLALSLRFPQPSSPQSRSWVEIYDVEKGNLLLTLQGQGDMDGFQWADQSGLFGFVSRKEEKATLWIGDLDRDGERVDALLRDVEHFGSWRFVPGGRSVLYGISTEGEKDPEGVKRYRGLTDRWAGARSHASLYQASIPDGAVRRLTAGDLETNLEDVARDASRLLFSRTRYTDASWPFSTVELYELDLQSLKAELLTRATWGISARYSPDGRRVLLLASPQAFGGIGLTVASDRIANLYDTQAYVLDVASGKIEPISRDFDPSIDEAVWSRRDGRIYARATKQSWRKLFRYDPRKRIWEELACDVDVINRMSLAADGSAIAFGGSSLNTPPLVQVARLRGRFRPQTIWSTDPPRYERILAGRVEDYSFTSKAGNEILGRIYYPPGFDLQRSYPAIVYYYGGTVPVTRDFGGRYPKELWASHGYVVYVPQPSGATGFGQEFSSRHVNDWGKTSAEEIIEGTQHFLDDHPSVDRERVGCIGASYGGFMTMLIITRTDQYAAAVAHAGISGIASYWGEGDWGYLYSGAATAKSYPWNRPDIYVDQSPLFAADKIHTPLLLLHGSIDNNVPPGESEQLYTALRVLGREVEFVRVEGQRHWILDYEKRKLWAQTIVAWFDRQLEGERQWWDALYPEGEDKP